MKRKFEMSMAISVLWALVNIGLIQTLNLADFFQTRTPLWLKVFIPTILVAVAIVPILLVIYIRFRTKWFEAKVN